MKEQIKKKTKAGQINQQEYFCVPISHTGQWNEDGTYGVVVRGLSRSREVTSNKKIELEITDEKEKHGSFLAAGVFFWSFMWFTFPASLFEAALTTVWGR